MSIEETIEAMSETDIENEIQTKGLNAPRLTPADIDAAPELYEALRVSVEVLEKTANDTLIGRNAAESGRTVLAKALGEAQESEK